MDTTSHVLLTSGDNHGYNKSHFIDIWWQSGILQVTFYCHLVTIMDTTSHVLLTSSGNQGYYKSRFIDIW